jgi:DNA-binding CsgD family transcriptional regulator
LYSAKILLKPWGYNTEYSVFWTDKLNLMTNSNTESFDIRLIKEAWRSNSLTSNPSDIAEILIKNPLLNNTMKLRRESVAIIDLRQMQYLHTFGDPSVVCGWSAEEIVEKGVTFFLSKLVAADYIGLAKMSEVLAKYVCELSDEQMTDFSYLFDFRMVHPDGKVTRVMQEGVSLQRDSSGNIAFLLALISDISHMKRDHTQHMSLKTGSEQLIFVLDNGTGICKKCEPLTKRELEIARLIGKKLSSEEIAQKLFISINTVHTHRQNMLRKFAMEDTMELLNFLTIYQII